MAWQTPKTDWATNPKNPKSEDFNRIEGNIEFLKTDIETKKGLIVTAINDMNQPALVTDTHLELANKIRSISSDANAAVGDVEKGKTFYAGGAKKTGTLELTGDAATGNVLSGKTFYNTDLKTKFTGIMPNRGKAIITPGPANKPIAAGYHDGTGYVVGDADLVAANIRKGVDIFGVTGSLAEVPWFYDFSAYTTYVQFHKEQRILVGDTYTVMDVIGPGWLTWFRDYGPYEQYQLNIIVDGVPLPILTSRGSNNKGAAVAQPIYFSNSLNVTIQNTDTNLIDVRIGYAYMLQTKIPDTSKHAIRHTGAIKRLNSTSSSAMLDITGAGYLLAFFRAGGGQSMTITIDGQAYSLLNDPVNMVTPIRFNTSLNIGSQSYGVYREVLYSLD